MKSILVVAIAALIFSAPLATGADEVVLVDAVERVMAEVVQTTYDGKTRREFFKSVPGGKRKKIAEELDGESKWLKIYDLESGEWVLVDLSQPYRYLGWAPGGEPTGHLYIEFYPLRKQDRTYPQFPQLPELRRLW